MSRTYKDMPERVQLARHPKTAPVKRVRECHTCSPHRSGRANLYAHLDGDIPCDIDEVKPPGAKGSGFCRRLFSAGYYYSKPDFPGAVREKMNAPLRGHARKFAVEAIKDHRAGLDDPGQERDALIPRPTQHGPLGGGYWW